MKSTIIIILTALIALITTATEIDVQTPFKKGRKTPILWWSGSDCKLIEDNGKTAVAIASETGIANKTRFAAKAADKVEFAITLSSTKGMVSVRLGTWAKEGYITEQAYFIKKSTPQPVVYKGEIILKDAEKADSKGIMRKLSQFDIRIHAHRGSEDVKVHDLKINLIPKE